MTELTLHSSALPIIPTSDQLCIAKEASLKPVLPLLMRYSGPVFIQREASRAGTRQALGTPVAEVADSPMQLRRIVWPDAGGGRR